MKKNKQKHAAKNESRKRRNIATHDNAVSRSLRSTDSKHRRGKHIGKKCNTGGCPN